MPRFTLVLIMAVVLAAPAAAEPLGLRASSASLRASTAQAHVSKSRILLAGRPFFPIMVLGQCTESNVAKGRELGINLFMSGDCGSLPTERELALVAGSGIAVLPMAGRTARGPALAGWTFPDEPENNRWSPDGLRQAYPYRRGSDDGLLSFMTTGAGFFTRTDNSPPRGVYRGFARLADVAGFDLYPLGHCQHDLVAVYNAQRDYVGLVGPGTPTFQWIETGPIVSTYCGGFQMQPNELRAEVWLAIAGGARGIGYFTQTFSPDHRTFDVQPAIGGEMLRTNRQLRLLTPALLGRASPATADTGSIKLVARNAGGRTYVFAVNSTRDYVKAQLQVPGLGKRRVRAIDENRTLRAGLGGRLIDHFAPLAVHLYVAG